MPSVRSPGKKSHHAHGHSGCRCTLLNILLGATVFVALNILFSYSYLKHGVADSGEFAPSIGTNVGGAVQIQTDLPITLPLNSTLPSFSTDDSEIFMGSVIERGEESQLHLVVFLLSQHMLTAEVKKAVLSTSLHKDRLNNTASKLKDVLYKPNGQRSKQPFHICKIKNSRSSAAYVVPGLFLPNRQHVDPNSNRRLDILRCGMKSQPEILEFIGSDDAVQVEIYRGLQLLHCFEVPWRERRAGYMLASPPEASRWDPWRGLDLAGENRSTTSSSMAKKGKDAVYLCAPAVRRPPSRASMGPLLEFVEHHLSIGVSHIFLGVAFSWKSPHMAIVLQLLKSYIVEGSVSIVSEAGDGIDYASSFLGLRYTRGDTKTIFNNMCLYLSKGSASYAAFWDIDQFFVPEGPVANIGYILSMAHSAEDMARASGRQIAHPVCYFSVSSKEYYPLYNAGFEAPWIGFRFAYESLSGSGMSPSRSIVPTNIIFSAGVLTAATCRLDPKWTSCKIDELQDNFCITGGSSSGLATHNFDQRMSGDDVLNIPAKIGMLHHYQTYANAKIVNPRDAFKNRGNIYSKQFFPAVLAGLKSRGLEAIISLPTTDMDALSPDVGEWKELTTERHAESDITQIAAADLLGEFFNSPEEGTSSDRSFKSAQPKGISVLPEFANDMSELFLSSLIEREFESPKLRLTVFLMNHAQLLRNAVSGVNVISVNSTMKPVWDAALRSFVSATYLPTGERSQNYHCRVSLSSNAAANWTSKCRFMPNRLTPDANANRKLDVLRCPLMVTIEEFNFFHRSEEYLQIEILRGDYVLIHYAIPWKTRRSGYMLTSPVDGDGFDAWKGASNLYEKARVNSESRDNGVDLNYGVVDNLYMCVPGMESPFDKRVLPLYAEFVEHHLQLGVDHMFISATYDLYGSNMKLLSSAFRSYVNDGLMTLSSQAGDMEDFRYGFKGLTFDRDNIKVMFVNMCLYLAKGSADYVAIWDFDEFFIPKLPHNSILDVIRFAEGKVPVALPQPGENVEDVLASWKKGPGVADGDGHPFCYIIVNSETINSDGDEIDPDHPWIGNRFSHDTEITHLSFQKSILPTRKIFQAGLHIGGSCYLPFPWNGCTKEELAETEFCYRADKSVGVGALNKVTWINSSYFIDFMRFHAFDEGASVEDAKRLDIEKDAIIYHIQAHRAHLVSNKDALNGPVNEYASRFFGRVLKKLRQRGIALLQTLPKIHRKDVRTASAYWDPIIPLLDPTFKGPIGPEKLTVAAGETAALGAEWKPNSSVFASKHSMATLPSFSEDGKDYVLGSIIERVSDSTDLYVTSFFLGHDMLDPSKKGDLHGSRVAASVKDSWLSFARNKWPVNHNEPWMAPGGKAPNQYFCRIKNTANDSDSYVSVADVVPNKGTPDSGANRRLDIMRCKMRYSETAYAKLHASSAEIIVELLRDNDFLMRFSIPWRSRKTGYTLSSVEGASNLNSWKGAIEIITNNLTQYSGGYRGRASNGRDRLHLCVPGLESHPDKVSIPLYLEFIQHHLLLGVDHISLSTVFAWGSKSMDRLLMLLHSYIEDGSVSVSSQAGDGINSVYSTSGMSWFRDNSKIFFVNMCVYHAKGNADYVGIWDFDEFFIPKSPHSSIIDVISSIEGSGSKISFPGNNEVDDPLFAQSKWKGAAGFADGHMHPLCYIMLSSEVVCSDNSDGAAFDYSKPWIGQRFTHGIEPPESDVQHKAFKKSIVPTDRIFQVGLHMHGACSLPYPWNGCSRRGISCYSNGTKEKMGVSYTANRTLVDFTFTQSIDGAVWDSDAKKVDSHNQGVIYHFQVHRSYLGASNQSIKGEANDYVKYFFPKVISKLKERGFVLLENFPDEFGSKLLYDDSNVHLPWKPIFTEFMRKLKVRELFP